MNYKERIARLKKLLKTLSIDALIVDDPVNLYYLTGQQLSLGMILIHAKNAHLIVDNRYFESCRQNSPIEVILAEAGHASLIKLLVENNASIKTIGFSSETTTYKNFQDYQSCIKSLEVTLTPLANPVMKLRSIKDADEIQLLREASELGSKGYDFICTLLEEGIREIDLAIELEIFWKRNGSKSLAFDPIIAFGPNSSMPHYRAGNARLKKGDNVLIDIGVNLQHYHSDMTRVVFFGEPDPRMTEIYGIVRNAQKAALTLCKPGTTIGTLDATARDIIASKGFGDQFTHSLGHGVGLEIHEWPTLRNTPALKNIPLEPGMVITIEPGIYLPGIGGIRLEDTVAITTTGYENLTNRKLS